MYVRCLTLWRIWITNYFLNTETVYFNIIYWVEQTFPNIATSKKARGDNSRNKCKLNITKIYSKYFWEQQLSL